MTTIKDAFREAREKAGLPKKMCPYTARHGRLTDVGKVVSLKEVMEIGGHGDVKTALRYQHPDPAELQRKLEAAETTGRVQ